MKSPNVEYNEETKVYESHCPTGRLKTFFFLPSRIPQRFSIPTLHIHVSDALEPFKFVGRYSASKKAMRFALIGPKGYKYRLDLHANREDEEPSSSWKTTRKGMTDKRTEAIVVPEVVIRGKNNNNCQELQTTTDSEFSPWGCNFATEYPTLLLHIAIASSPGLGQKPLMDVSNCKDITSTASSAMALMTAAAAAGATTTTTTVMTSSPAAPPEGARPSWSQKLIEKTRRKRKPKTKVEQEGEADSDVSGGAGGIRKQLDALRRAAVGISKKKKSPETSKDDHENERGTSIGVAGITTGAKVAPPAIDKKIDSEFHVSYDNLTESTKSEMRLFGGEAKLHNDRNVDDRDEPERLNRTALIAKIHEAFDEKMKNLPVVPENPGKNALDNNILEDVQSFSVDHLTAATNPEEEPCKLYRFVSDSNPKTTNPSISTIKVESSCRSRGSRQEVSSETSEAWETIEIINEGGKLSRRVKRNEGRPKRKHSTTSSGPKSNDHASTKRKTKCTTNTKESEDEVYPSVKEIVDAFNQNTKEIEIEPVVEEHSSTLVNESCVSKTEGNIEEVTEDEKSSSDVPPILEIEGPVIKCFNDAIQPEEPKLLEPKPYSALLKTLVKETNKVPQRYSEHHPPEWNEVVEQIADITQESSEEESQKESCRDYPTSDTEVDTDGTVEDAAKKMMELVIEVQGEQRHGESKYYLVQCTK